jgi:predicted small secreted protein
MKRLTALTLIALMGTLTACETMEGLGRDTSKLGKNVENSAEKNDGNPSDDSAVQGQ